MHKHHCISNACSGKLTSACIKDEQTSSPKDQGSWSVVSVSECPRQNGNKDPMPIHLPKSFGVALPANPPISGPESGWPLRPWIFIYLCQSSFMILQWSYELTTKCLKRCIPRNQIIQKYLDWQPAHPKHRKGSGLSWTELYNKKVRVGEGMRSEFKTEWVFSDAWKDTFLKNYTK